MKAYYPLPLLLLSLLAGGCSSDESDVCQDAIDLVDQCTGERAAYPPEGCIGSFAEQSAALVEGGCEGLTDDKADLWCSAALSWIGLCSQEALEDVAVIDTVNEVCPSSRSDALCESLRNADNLAADATKGGDRDTARDAFAAALTEAKSAMLADADGARQDPAYRYIVRERSLSLLVYNVLTELGTKSAAADYSDAAQALLTEHFPAYPPESFPLAMLDLPPVDAQSCASEQGLLIFPGVVRLTERSEFDEQAAAIEAALPCFHVQRVETGSFVLPTINADQAEIAVAALTAEFGAMPLHALGYSQGASNLLRTLTDKPAIKSQVRTVMVMNSAAHGSEVADMGVSILDPIAGGVEDFCTSLPEFALPLCEVALSASPRPDEWVLELIAMSMGVPLDSLQAFIEAEDGVSNAPDLRSFFERHLPGVASLSTTETQRFWDERGADLPRTTLYYSFRSAISDTDANLPSSNALFHSLLERAGGDRPYNDMQVRIDNQSLGGAVADLEVVSPVAEGNHWQWELPTGAVPESTMPAEMTDRIPHRELLVGHYQALLELGAAE